MWYANTMDQLSNLKHKIVTSEAVTILRGGAAERVRDDFLMRSIKKSSRTSKVRDDVCFHYTIDEPWTLEAALSERNGIKIARTAIVHFA